jgi:replicative DNA helicase
MSDNPPHDHAAERAVLGAALLQPDIVPELAGILRDDDWHHPAHVAIWFALADLAGSGHPVDPITVAAAVGNDQTLRGLGGPLYIAGLLEDVPAVASATWYARIVADRAAERRTVELGTWLMQAGHGGTDADTVHDRIGKHLADRATSRISAVHVRTIDEFLAGDDAEDDYDWVIPGLLERHDRLMLTGPEGGGKSTLCRQVGIQAATGVQPFTADRTAPARVLFIDLENSERQSRRKLRPLRIQAGQALDPDRFHIEVRPSGIDLLDRDDVAWLLSRVASVRPDVLITGPIYRMATGDPTEEKTAKPVSVALDRVRDTGCAVVLETHTPHAVNGQRRRPLRPYGASLWMRWPEFGIHLAEDGAIDHWRGPRDEREWPAGLTRGGAWPWSPVTDDNALRWSRIQRARVEADVFMSERDVVEATGMPKSTVHRVLRKYRFDWVQLNGRDPADTKEADE